MYIEYIYIYVHTYSITGDNELPFVKVAIRMSI